MTIQQIIDWVDRKYPNQETVTNKIIDLNDIYKEIFLKIRTLDNSYSEDDILTVANQELYALAVDCKVDKIISVKLSDSTTVSTATVWTNYTHAGVNDTLVGNQYLDGQDGKIKLFSEGIPITSDGLTARISYYPQPEELTLETQTPLLNSKYHGLLKYSLAQSMASQGNNPDVEMANYYQAKFDEFMVVVRGDLGAIAAENPTQVNQLAEGW